MRWAFHRLVVALAFAIFLLALGVVAGGHVDFFLFPKTDAESVMAQLTLPQGTPADRTLAVSTQIEKAAWQLNEMFATEGEDPVVQRAMTVVGIHTSRNPEVGSHAGEVTIELASVETRSVPSATILNKWRELTGDIPEALALTFGTREIGPGGSPIEIRLIGERFDEARRVRVEVEPIRRF